MCAEFDPLVWGAETFVSGAVGVHLPIGCQKQFQDTEAEERDARGQEDVRTEERPVCEVRGWLT